MSAITYTAARELASGHSSGTSYNLEFEVSQVDRSGKTKKRINESLNGVRETIRYHKKSYYDVTAVIIPKADIPLWEEWFYSVDAGESFTFDPYGTIAVPDNPISVVIDSKDIEFVRFEETDYFSVSFRVAF